MGFIFVDNRISFFTKPPKFNDTQHMMISHLEWWKWKNS